MAYVYRHIRLDKNVPFYIGIGLNDDYRRAKNVSKRTEFWRKIARKTGYEVEIMIDNISWEEACIKEIEFIKIYGRINLGTGSLVNLTDGGDGKVGYIVSEETKAKMSKIMTGRKFTDEQRIKMGVSRIGIKLSEPHKEKIRLAGIGRKHSEASKKLMSEKHSGKIITEQTRQKLIQSHKGKKQTQETKDKRAKGQTKVFLEHDGMKKSLKEWAEYLGVKKSLITYRYYSNWETEDILNTPKVPFVERNKCKYKNKNQ